MNPGHPRILTCPNCGGKKQVLSLASGNTFGAKVWSDNKRIYPMLPSPSFIQKCPHCEDYFLLSRQETQEYGRGCFCLNQGRLSYEDLKEAYFKLSQLPDLTDEENTTMLFYLVWSYNDRYNCETPSGRADELPDSDEKYDEREIVFPPYLTEENLINDWESSPCDVLFKTENNEDNVSEDVLPDEGKPSEKVKLMVAPSEERAFIEGIVLKLVDHVSDPLMKAELLREIGRFDEASEILKQVSSKSNFLMRFRRLMADYIHKKETKSIDLTPLMYASDKD